MSVYHPFGPGDVLYSVIYASPRVVLASGTSGWRGNVGASSSLSLYGGVRSRPNVRASDFPTSGLSVYPIDPLDTHSIDKVIFVSGSYPSTGSVRYVTARRAEATSVLTQVTADDWWQEHFNPIDRLFDYYSRIGPDYFTGSYDFYDLYLKSNVPYTASCVLYSGSTLSNVTSSFTMEARVKPMSVTSSVQDFTILSQRGRFKFYITGSDGRLAFSDTVTSVTSSVPLTKGVWQHVSVSVSSSTLKMFLDLQEVASQAFTSSLLLYAGALTSSSSASFLTVGAEHVVASAPVQVRPDMGYHGFLYETRIWSSARTTNELSSSAGRSLTSAESGSSRLVHYSRFNDGPLSSLHGFVQGSGAMEYGRAGLHGQLTNVNTTLPLGPTWHPNDDVGFVTYKVPISATLDYMKVLHVPSMFYGRQIATGSVRLVCQAYNRQGIVRVLQDDGRGGLYVSGSVSRASGGEDYRGVGWNKVGNVFYVEGLIVLTDPSLWDFGASGKDSTTEDDLLQVQFDGVSRVPTKTFMCRMDAGDSNCSNNPTFHVYDDRGTVDTSDDRIVPIRSDGTTYVTAIGLYNEERRLVAVAKIAQPIRKREKDRSMIRLRMDF